MAFSVRTGGRRLLMLRVIFLLLPVSVAPAAQPISVEFRLVCKNSAPARENVTVTLYDYDIFSPNDKVVSRNATVNDADTRPTLISGAYEDGPFESESYFLMIRHRCTCSNGTQRVATVRVGEPFRYVVKFKEIVARKLAVNRRAAEHFRGTQAPVYRERRSLIKLGVVDLAKRHDWLGRNDDVCKKRR